MGKSLDMVYELFVVKNNQVIYIPVVKIKWPGIYTVATFIWVKNDNDKNDNDKERVQKSNQPITQSGALDWVSIVYLMHDISYKQLKWY